MRRSEEDEFARSLAELKRRGCGILVVGTPSSEARRAAARRLLGDATVGPRRRLFVFTGDAATDERLGNGPIGPSTVRVVSRATATRRPDAASAPSAPEPVPRRTVRSERLSRLASIVSDEIGSFESEAGALRPGELRLCLDSLSPLLSTYEEPAVRRLVAAVTNRVKAVSGMAHYHLPARADDPAVVRLGRAFDALIELRVRDGAPVQRWYLPERDCGSGWLPL
ncbi:DUF7504 family protein [Halegenticoccus soli]|uniref:DUF7504 family protein n=1 Tax=Halegenticoccus soli TaxID=1985678 RepID=UPI000C6C9A42|nr:hypothetical protein [Halegenticoccus soli]